MLGAWAVQREQVIHSAFAPYAIYFCYAVLVAAVLLSWYQDQSRLLCLTLAIGVAVWGWSHFESDAHAAQIAITLLLPLNFVFFGTVGERGVLTFRGVLKLAFIVVQSLLVWGLSFANPPSLLPWNAQAQGIWFALVALVLLVLAWKRRNKIQQCLPWALGAVFLGLKPAATLDSLFFYSGTAGLVFVVAILEHGYELATRDELTGLPSRRVFNRVLEQLGRRYTIAMCDVDHFKQFNDAHGHEGGDQVLKMVASMMSTVPGSHAFRYGGEEFALIFTGSSAKDAEPLVEALREAIAKRRFVLREPGRPKGKWSKEKRQQAPQAEKRCATITISIGLAEHSKQLSRPELVLDAADTALYQAKESGRNCVKLAPEPSSVAKTAGSGKF